MCNASSSLAWLSDTDSFPEMKYIVAALYSNYKTAIIDDTGIEQSDAYTAPPKNSKLLIRLQRLDA